MNNNLPSNQCNLSPGHSNSNSPKDICQVLKGLEDLEKNFRTCLLYAILFTKPIKWKSMKATPLENLCVRPTLLLGKNECAAPDELVVTEVKQPDSNKCRSYLKARDHKSDLPTLNAPTPMNVTDSLLPTLNFVPNMLTRSSSICGGRRT